MALLGAAALLIIPVAGHGSQLLAFPQASLEEETSIRSASYRVMLSPIREADNEVRAEQSVRLAVEGSGRLYLLEPGASRDNARRWYLEQLQAMNASILFHCEGRRCGRSNVWANQVFDQSTLYGRDADQDYLVAGFEDDSGRRWLVVLYTITRGNQREYLWLERLELSDDAIVPGLDGAVGRLSGPMIVPWEGDISISVEWDVETRRQIREKAQDPDSRIVLAGFTALGSDETVEQALERSQKAVQTMSDLLDRSGISRSRHIIRNLGPLVRIESPGRPPNRIEILIVAPPEGGRNIE
ncbi:DUF4892 domain-containing protein [Marinobacter zhanjiangensis]|uniref:DUF4892 domain-containing protein n=1 Tax=Marinobacter zhanjiangensis TaxID=578215 RepID=A0ABQ3B7K1_9GAMM|nr:DUF4892 domain-containing protein [Marinobacter zhanjiangensis]GGY82434.1 hypothetical protein GCM10007071_32340 [Marinobacter zhanjiangensis]